jgi:hypothetical protein
MGFSNVCSRAEAQWVELARCLPAWLALTAAALFRQCISTVVHEKSAVAFDLDQPGVAHTAPKPLDTLLDDVKVLDVLRIRPKIDLAPSRQDPKKNQTV